MGFVWGACVGGSRFGCTPIKIKYYSMGCSSPQNAGIPNIPAQHLNRVPPPTPSSCKSPTSTTSSTSTRSTNTSHASAKEPPSGQATKKYHLLTQTYGYDCLTTAQELAAKRKEFWGSPADK